MARNHRTASVRIPRDQESGRGGVPFETPDLPIVNVLGGRPIECIDVYGKRIDVTLMTRLGVCAKGALEVIDTGDPALEDIRYHTYRIRSDAAQVIASYLACHPQVSEVRYPGLKTDPSFAIAARTLQGGFGPIVDYRVSTGWKRLEAGAGDVRDQIMELEHKLVAGA